MLNALTIDLEEYFHPSEVQTLVGVDQWSLLPSRLADQTNVILDLLDSRQVQATFFVLGWVAKNHPAIVRQIVDRGHEIGCHSFAHQLVYNLTPQQFRQDTARAVDAIENACGVSPYAYRAPSFSITEKSFWALEILVECGFTHDSSIYPIGHDRYGIPGFPRNCHAIQTPSGPITEIPIATVELSPGKVAPVGGGAYLRLLPYSYTAAGIRRINQQEKQPACIYFHPWELDPSQPRMARGFIPQFRTYAGLRSMAGKVNRLLKAFQFSSMGVVYPAQCSLVENSSFHTVIQEPDPSFRKLCKENSEGLAQLH
jgi:polysaccharide deacetylase family protein (PEP-CTERM system associated)